MKPQEALMKRRKQKKRDLDSCRLLDMRHQMSDFRIVFLESDFCFLGDGFRKSCHIFGMLVWVNE